MGINRDNYKLFLSQMLDGTLAPELEANLWSFLDDNPDLVPTDSDANTPILSPDKAMFASKEGLKKEPFQKHGVDNEVAYLCIAEFENGLSPLERKNLEILASKSPLVSSERSLYSKIALEYDNSISFPNKSTLKRRAIQPISTPVRRWAYGVAAAVALLIGAYSILNINEPINVEQPLLTETEQVPELMESIEPMLTATDKIIPQSTKIQDKVIAEHVIVEERGANNRSNEDEQIHEDSRIIYDTPQPIKPIQIAQIAYTPNTQVKLIRDYDNAPIGLFELEDDYTPPSPGGHKRALGLFELAQIGINRIGEFTGRNLSLTADADPYGNITRIHFESSLFAVSTPVRRDE